MWQNDRALRCARERKTSTGFTGTLHDRHDEDSRYRRSPVRARRVRRGRHGRERDRPVSRQGGGRDQPRRPAHHLRGSSHRRGGAARSRPTPTARCSRSTASARRSRWASTSRPPRRPHPPQRHAARRLARAVLHETAGERRARPLHGGHGRHDGAAARAPRRRAWASTIADGQPRPHPDRQRGVRPRIASCSTASRWATSRCYNVDGVGGGGAGLDVALLGMSFLNRTEMRRDGAYMTLTKRY